MPHNIDMAWWLKLEHGIGDFRVRAAVCEHNLDAILELIEILNARGQVFGIDIQDIFLALNYRAVAPVFLLFGVAQQRRKIKHLVIDGDNRYLLELGLVNHRFFAIEIEMFRCRRNIVPAHMHGLFEKELALIHNRFALESRNLLREVALQGLEILKSPKKRRAQKAEEKQKTHKNHLVWFFDVILAAAA